MVSYKNLCWWNMCYHVSNWNFAICWFWLFSFIICKLLSLALTFLCFCYFKLFCLCEKIQFSLCWYSVHFLKLLDLLIAFLTSNFSSYFSFTNPSKQIFFVQLLSSISETLSWIYVRLSESYVFLIFTCFLKFFLHPFTFPSCSLWVNWILSTSSKTFIFRFLISCIVTVKLSSLFYSWYFFFLVWICFTRVVVFSLLREAWLCSIIFDIQVAMLV